jgi:hypothetical protein
MTRAMTAAEFEGRLRQLTGERIRRGPNRACIACERCEGCSESTFCLDSKALGRCHYCSACDDCIECSHCLQCQGCMACQHCVSSDGCVQSAYLIRSSACFSCNYCFGCVGLARRDFHILNEPYDRATYFELTSRLSRELRIRLP